jgi:hypothetical protein
MRHVGILTVTSEVLQSEDTTCSWKTRTSRNETGRKIKKKVRIWRNTNLKKWDRKKDKNKKQVRIWRVSSAMSRRVVCHFADISEEDTASIFRCKA